MGIDFACVCRVTVGFSGLVDRWEACLVIVEIGLEGVMSGLGVNRGM